MVKSTSWMAAAITTFAGVASATFPIPQHAPNRNAPARLDWEQFISNDIRRSLWYHTLSECQSRNEAESDAGSYYQIGSIHGAPQAPWDGNSGFNDMHQGFCYHNDPIFGPWHRPYIALQERSLQQCCTRVVQRMTAAGNPNVRQYDAECKRLRLPYWDWAKSRGLPTGCDTPTIDVTSLDGRTTTEMANPMYSYRFHNDNEYFGQGAQTRRAASADQALRDNADQLSGAIAALFRTDRVGTGSVTYAEAISYGQGGMNSIENIHGWIHVWMGGYMSDIDAAGFDPLFMLHHCFIDLLVSAWEMLNPDQRFGLYRNPYGSWTQAANTEEDLDTPLMPFHKQDGNPWTPRDCVDHTSTGATYDVFVNRGPQEVHTWIQSTYGDGGSIQAGGWEEEGGEDDQSGFEKREETPSYGSPSTSGSNSYGAGSSPSAGGYDDKTKTEKQPAAAEKDESFDKKKQPQGQGHGGKHRGLRSAPDRATLYKHRAKLYRENDKKQHTWHQYHAHYNGSRKHIPCSYTMHAFLGEPTEKDPSKFTEDPAYVGSYPVFSKKGGMDMPSSGYVPITNAILNYAVAENDELKDTSPEHVQEFVKKNMQWRISAVDGKDYNTPEMLNNFNFGLLDNEVTDVAGKLVFGPVKSIIDGLEGLLLNATANIPIVGDIVEGVVDALKDTAGLGKILGGASPNREQSSGSAGPDSQRGQPGTIASAGETPAGKVALPFKA